jgi:Family of unknown function (DUF5895)
MTVSKYLSQEYAAKDFNFPYAQAVRGELNPAHCGYFVPLAQAEKAGWKNIDGTEMTEYTYNSGKTEVGVLMTKPRMVITPICQLGAFDRQASQAEETLVVLGEWDRTKHSSDPNVGNFQIFLVMFLAPNNQPLHDVPLKLMAKGSHQATPLRDVKQKRIKRCLHLAIIDTNLYAFSSPLSFASWWGTVNSNPLLVMSMDTSNRLCSIGRISS